MNEELTSRKIYPRNLTALADKWQKGNPVTARPESGVDNSFPGLEFDQRNLDKRFFPGLEFEYHFGTPPILRRVEPEKASKPINLTTADVGDALILYKLFGTFGSADLGIITREISLENSTQLSAWRIIHDLEPGHIGILLAPFSPNGPPELGIAEQDEADAAMRGNNDFIRRNASGNLRFAVITGDRVDYLNDEGVINPSHYEPGDLTRSLCAPWQYDFADCGCFYWASNKPDMVAGEPDGDQFYNFQRRRDPATEPPTGGPGSTPQERAQFQTIQGWNQNTLGHREMIEEWEGLPIVLEATETTTFDPTEHVVLPPNQVLSRDEVIRRLKYVATVEHGLMVEYLYAYYSIDAPTDRPTVNGTEARKYDVANTVLSIAIDEMRHFRWVNEILRELNESTVIDRVGAFEDLDQDNRFFDHDFSLEALTRDRLSWFIDVERPSKAVDPSLAGDTIDGLYTRILLSIRQNADFSVDEKARLLHLIKLIIDEGFDHFTRFQNIQSVLSGLSSNDYLRLDSQPVRLASGHPAKVAELTTDKAYSVVLATLMLVFSQSNVNTGDLLQAARFAMYALDDAAKEVIRLGGAPLFTLPSFVSGTSATDLATAAVAAIGQPQKVEDYIQDQLLTDIQPLLDGLRGSGSAETADTMAERYKGLKDALMDLLK